MKNVYPYKLKAFKTVIKDMISIQELLKSRIAMFKKALDNTDPLPLGRCRYYKMGCRFTGTDICSCEDLGPLDTSLLTKSISLEYDDDYTKKLDSIRGDAIDESVNCYTTRDILLPRKYFMNNVRGIESLYQPDPRKEEYKTCLGDTINSFKKEFDAELTPEENEKVKTWIKDSRIKIGHRWLKIKKSGSPEGVMTPYILKVNNTPIAKYARKPHDYYVAELGVVCGLYGRDNGVICTVYPRLNNHVQVFDVRFRSHNAIYGIVKDVISRIEEAQEIEEIHSLPVCPDYMNDKGNCPLFDECNPE
jgi:hypothetical protein